MKKLLKNIGLYLLSLILKPILSFIGIIYGVFKNPKGISEKFYNMAQSNDRFVNVTCAEFMNNYFVELDTPIPFGDGRKVISGILGSNAEIEKLKDNKHWWKSGIWWNTKLNKIDPGHTKKAIGWRGIKK